MRPSTDEYLLRLAEVAATRTTCIRRGVGCVLADARGRVLAVAYNGVASGQDHCNEPAAGIVAGYDFVRMDPHPRSMYPHACEGFDLPPGQDRCEAIHAEQNALVQCADADRIDTAYVTLGPCKPCAKLLLGTRCRRIVCRADHASLEGRDLWVRAGRSWEVLPGAQAGEPVAFG
jgi:dCMP deaminase